MFCFALLCFALLVAQGTAFSPDAAAQATLPAINVTPGVQPATDDWWYWRWVNFGIRPPWDSTPSSSPYQGPIAPPQSPVPLPLPPLGPGECVQANVAATPDVGGGHAVFLFCGRAEPLCIDDYPMQPELRACP